MTCTKIVSEIEIEEFIQKRLQVQGIQEQIAIVMVGGPGSGKS